MRPLQGRYKAVTRPLRDHREEVGLGLELRRDARGRGTASCHGGGSGGRRCGHGGGGGGRGLGLLALWRVELRGVEGVSGWDGGVGIAGVYWRCWVQR